MNIRNNEKVSKWQDKTNKQDWKYQLKIQKQEYKSQKRQYKRSNEIADQQLTFNAMAQKVANEAEYRKLEDSTKRLHSKTKTLSLKLYKLKGLLQSKVNKVGVQIKQDKLN
jgi:hypothetical protein